ncbi:DUF6059 family protein [Streptomyces sp. MH13]|uniref:DUF6059 family protein n=1 Tax=Streptomyces sp. MH13 TaxID=3417651 RepID=UPI003CF012A7
MGRRRGGVVVRRAVSVVTAVYRALVVHGACWVPLPAQELRRFLDGGYAGAGEGRQGAGAGEGGPYAGAGHGGRYADGGQGDDDGVPSDGHPNPHPHPDPHRDGRSARGVRLTGPGPGHPERLRRDIPLTALERRLRRELDAR